MFSDAAVFDNNGRFVGRIVIMRTAKQFLLKKLPADGRCAGMFFTGNSQQSMRGQTKEKGKIYAKN